MNWAFYCVIFPYLLPFVLFLYCFICLSISLLYFLATCPLPTGNMISKALHSPCNVIFLWSSFFLHLFHHILLSLPLSLSQIDELRHTEWMRERERLINFHPHTGSSHHPAARHSHITARVGHLLAVPCRSSDTAGADLQGSGGRQRRF